MLLDVMFEQLWPRRHQRYSMHQKKVTIHVLQNSSGTMVRSLMKLSIDEDGNHPSLQQSNVSLHHPSVHHPSLHHPLRRKHQRKITVFQPLMATAFPVYYTHDCIVVTHILSMQGRRKLYLRMIEIQTFTKSEHKPGPTPGPQAMDIRIDKVESTLQ